MTAEIAILNKSAVALATDSAVTITSAGSYKVFDSADKLFELSCSQPIGIMVYNGMQYAGIPLPDLVKEFRNGVAQFDTVEDAANAFLDFLNQVGASAPEGIQRQVAEWVATQLLSQIEQRVHQIFREGQLSLVDGGAANATLQDVYRYAIAEAAEKSTFLPRGEFWGSEPAVVSEQYRDWLREEIRARFFIEDESLITSLVLICERLVLSSILSESFTGLVFSGFGERERFPTLVSYEVEGPLLGRLKTKRTAYCDIDRNGANAFVMPFAQREMVERFLYGLDEQIQTEILRVCRGTIRCSVPASGGSD